MGQYDAHDNIKIKETVPIQTVGTTGTGRTGGVIDRSGFAGVEFLIGFGSVTATNATFTVVPKEGDVTGTMTAIAAGDLLGSAANGTVVRRPRGPLVCRKTLPSASATRV